MITIFDEDQTVWGIYNTCTETWVGDYQCMLYASNRKEVIEAQLSCMNVFPEMNNTHPGVMFDKPLEVRMIYEGAD